MCQIKHTIENKKLIIRRKKNFLRPKWGNNAILNTFYNLLKMTLIAFLNISHALFNRQNNGDTVNRSRIEIIKIKIKTKISILLAALKRINLF
jgi:hypothetical protein